MHFPVSGVDTHPLIPVAVAFAISFFTSIGGISGAFLLLPFQVSVLNFTSPAVSSTNLVFNTIATPGGVYRYIKEGRMAWPLAITIIAGSLPGIFLGVLIRLKYFLDPRALKFFVGCVLLFIGYRMVMDMVHKLVRGNSGTKPVEEGLQRQAGESRNAEKAMASAHLPPDAVVETASLSFARITYAFNGETFSFNPVILFCLALLVGIVGGIYGIGGGAIIAPFIVTFFCLPVYTIAGATLLGTFASSVAGIVIYLVLAQWHAGSGLAIAPDWLLGILFGVGGFAGIYCGARVQKFVPERIIKIGITVLILWLASRYVMQYFS